MTTPHELETDAELEWSPGTGADVWTMLHAVSNEDLSILRSEKIARICSIQLFQPK